MNEKRHYATVAPAGEPYIARVGDATIARSERAMLLEEVKAGTHYPVVVYFPRADVAAGALLPSDRHSLCPINGEAGYFSVKAGRARKSVVYGQSGSGSVDLGGRRCLQKTNQKYNII